MLIQRGSSIVRSLSCTGAVPQSPFEFKPPSGIFLSASIDGRMLLWDPVAGNTPVSSVSVGRPVNSACFSTGDPYALVCAPEREQASVGGGSGGCSSRESSSGSDELVQIWDLR